MKSTPNLRNLSMFNNEACPNFFNGGTPEQYDDYRLYVISKLPKMEVLETTKVSAEERERAAQMYRNLVKSATEASLLKQQKKEQKLEERRRQEEEEQRRREEEERRVQLEEAARRVQEERERAEREAQQQQQERERERAERDRQKQEAENERRKKQQPAIADSLPAVANDNNGSLPLPPPVAPDMPALPPPLAPPPMPALSEGEQTKAAAAPPPMDLMGELRMLQLKKKKAAPVPASELPLPPPPPPANKAAPPPEAPVAPLPPVKKTVAAKVAEESGSESWSEDERQQPARAKPAKPARGEEEGWE